MAATLSGRYDELPMISLDELTASHNRIDLLHIDIQGGEADFIAGTLPALYKKVAYLVVGTHSRQIEGRVMNTLLDAGWKLEIERPAIFALDDGRPRILVDGPGLAEPQPRLHLNVGTEGVLTHESSP